MKRFVASSSRASFALVLAALAAIAMPAHAGPVAQLYVDANNFSTGTSGANQTGAFIAYSIWNAGDVTLTPPITIRATLPAGLVYHATTTNGAWSCTRSGTPIQLTCTYGAEITTLNYQSAAVAVYFDVPVDFPEPFVSIDSTLASAQLPLPANPTCGASGATTQCVRTTRPVVQSALSIVSMQTFPTWYAGEEHNLVVNLRNTGYTTNNSPVRVRIRWPQGVTYSRPVNGIPVWTCTGAQVTICETPAMYDSQGGFLSVMARSDATTLPVPGPVSIVVSASNDSQPDADCVATPNAAGCATILATTAPARVPNLAITTTEVQGQPLLVESDHGFVVGFANGGNGDAGTWSLSVNLPRGYEYTGLASAVPSMTCGAGGSASVGQRVVCTVGGLPASVSGYASLRVRPRRGLIERAVSTAVVALEMASPPDPAVLAACASTPDAPHCAWQTLAARGVCGDFAEDVYCNGYESFPPSADAPAGD